MSYGHKGFDRNERVGQQLHEVVASLLLTEVDDPRVQNVQVTDVDVSPDLRNATVYYVLLDQREPDPQAQSGLERAAGYLKHEIGKRLDLKYVPKLNFEYDESVERGRRMEELLEDIDTGQESDEH